MKIFQTIYIFALAFQCVNAQTCPSDETVTDLLGPYYLPGAPVTKKLAPVAELKKANRRIKIKGTVYGSDCVPMSKVLVEPWHAGIPVNGIPYSLAGSSLKYRGRITTDSCGRYEFTTIYPTLYAQRPIIHIHIRVSKGDEEFLVTQMYFKGDITPGFDPDPNQIVTLKRLPNGSRNGTFNIYLDTDGTGSSNCKN
jgi:protocatechuate 3,4-dioxygenase beta subunit